MPGRLRVFLAQTRKPVHPAVLAAPSTSPADKAHPEKSMAERWAEYKRGEKKEKKEDSGDTDKQAEGTSTDSGGK